MRSDKVKKIFMQAEKHILKANDFELVLALVLPFNNGYAPLHTISVPHEEQSFHYHQTGTQS